MSALPQDYAAPGSDELLARRAARGDDDAFAELYRRYSGRLAAFGGRIVGDRTAGEDVAQTSLLKAYQAIRQGRGPTAVRPWLYRIAQNVAYESLRRRREIVGVEIEEGHEDQHEARLDRETLLEAVRVLPQRQRDVYLLRELNGLAVSEIARGSTSRCRRSSRRSSPRATGSPRRSSSAVGSPATRCSRSIARS